MKNTAVIIMLILLLGAGSYFFILKNQSLNLDKKTSFQVTPTASVKHTTMTAYDLEKNNLVWRCEYTNIKNKKTIRYTRGPIQRVDNFYIDETQTGTMLVRDSKIYIWNDETKEGRVLIISNPEGADSSKSVKELPKSYTPNTKTSPPQVYDDECKLVKADNNLFSVPTDIKFTEQQISNNNNNETDQLEKITIPPPPPKKP